MLSQMFQITTLESKKQDETNLFGKFLLRPLPFGHGITIGNTLRRILLNDIYGSAITGVEIIGINSEFATIPGVREDVLEILLNLKQIVLSSSETKMSFAHLKVLGPRIITAACIDFPEGTQVLNPNLYIATVYSETYIEMIFRIEYGQGYQLSEQIEQNSESNFLNMDGLFMPVRKVNFFVNDLYRSKNLQVNSEESLEIDIWTNGTITPQVALKSSIRYAVNLFNVLLTYPQPQDNKSLAIDILSHSKNIRIEDLYLSARVYKCLKSVNIHYLSDLINYSMEDLCNLKNFGQKCSVEVRDKLKYYFQSSLREF
jgi:DNA-directed RNA polymerase subunit alpha